MARTKFVPVSFSMINFVHLFVGAKKSMRAASFSNEIHFTKRKFSDIMKKTFFTR